MRRLFLLSTALLVGGLCGFVLAYGGKPKAAEQSESAPPPRVASKKSPLKRAVRRNLWWRAIESANYFVYVSNLRTIKCPEASIRAIIRADLMRTLQNQSPSADMIKVQQRIDDQLKELGVTPYRPKKYYLSAEQMDKVQAALTKFPLGSVAEEATNSPPRMQKIGPLQRDQFVYYKSEFELYGQTVVSVLKGFQPTKEEFFTIITSMTSRSRQDLTDRLATVLSPARYALFQNGEKSADRVVVDFCKSYPGVKRNARQLLKIFAHRNQLTPQEYSDELRGVLDGTAFAKFIGDYPHPKMKTEMPIDRTRARIREMIERREQTSP